MRMSVSRAHAHAGLACARARVARLFFLAQVNENDVSASTYLHCPGSFLRLLAHAVACLGACRCNKSGSSEQLPVHRSLCVSFSLSDALSFNTDPFTLAVLRPMGLFVCLAVLRCSPSGSLFCLLSGPNPPQLYFWVLTAFNLPKWTFQVVLRLACLLLFLCACRKKRLQSVQKWSERVVFFNM